MHPTVKRGYPGPQRGLCQVGSHHVSPLLLLHAEAT